MTIRAAALKLAVALVALGALFLGVQPASAGAAPQVIVLGDSIAAGCCVTPSERWATIFAEQLGVDLNNVGVGGATSSSLINEVRTWPSLREQPQLDEAVSLLGEAGAGDVEAVTLDIGGNDLLGLTNPGSGQPCIVDPVGCEDLVTAALLTLDANLHTIITELLAAMESGAPLLVMAYYNPLDDGTGTGDLVEPAVQQMNAVILAEIAEHGTGHVDAHAYFKGRAGELISGDIVHPSVAGHDLLADIFTNEVPPDSDGDGLSDVMEGLLGSNAGVKDSDSDGCTDGQEFGPIASQGGRRDPVNFWDFYDVSWPRDKKIDLMNDIFGVAFRFGATGNPGGDPLTVPPPAPAYHTAFDRGGVIPEGDPWDLLPANGNIDLMNDIFGVAFSFGHNCTT